jgi:uncharacterized membrane-anchored protein
MTEAATSLFVLGFTFLMIFFIFAYIMVMYAMVFGIIILVFVGLAFWMFMLIDCLQREEGDFPEDKPNEKNNWLVVLLVSFACGMSWLGALVYYFKVKKPMLEVEN